MSDHAQPTGKTLAQTAAAQDCPSQTNGLRADLMTSRVEGMDDPSPDF